MSKLVIDNTTYKASEDNYNKEIFPKKQIILAESLRKDHNHILRWNKKDFGKSKTWGTYSISREGDIYEHFNPKYYSDFMGNKEIDKKSISIVMENMGPLFFDYENDKHVNWCNEICPSENVFTKSWKDFSYWEKHNTIQITSLVKLCKQLCSEYKIEVDCVGFNFFTVEIASFEGIACRSNYSYDNNDPNPSFDFKFFLQKLDIKI